jgi:hypothetical protein
MELHSFPFYFNLSREFDQFFTQVKVKVVAIVVVIIVELLDLDY